jgi:RNA polymerase sigma-70 factor, ECF subfamily
MGVSREYARGLAALRRALVDVSAAPMVAVAGGSLSWLDDDHILASSATVGTRRRHAAGGSTPTGALTPVPNPPADHGDADLAASSAEDEAVGTRLIALVELARKGDKEAFGLLYDHYHGAVYRFLFYRTRSTQVAEDLTSETFFRALRSMTGFRWQGKDFGAWLMTIARNLATDHFKAGRTRLEMTTEDMGQHDSSSDGPEKIVMAGITNEMLLGALTKLPDEQRDCIIMRFLQGLSIAETAAILGRSDGAVKQLQLRGIRNLAKQMPDGIR